MSNIEQELKCMDCGIPYSGMLLDTVLPHDQWNIIAPDDGLLCANCIVNRASKLDHVIACDLQIRFAHAAKSGDEVAKLHAMVADSIDYLSDLQGEWKWKDGTTPSNQRHYNELKELISRVDEYLTLHPLPISGR